MQHNEPSAVERSLAIYRRLLRAYPPAFRERYGDEMARVFRDVARAAWRQTGFAGLIALWARTMTDTLVNATRERVRGYDEYKDTQRWKILRGILSWVVPPLVILAVFELFPALTDGIQAIKNRLLFVPPPQRGWYVLLGAIIPGLLSGLYGVPGWRARANLCAHFTASYSWIMWFSTSWELGLGSPWPIPIILPTVSGLFAWWSNRRNKTQTKRFTTSLTWYHLSVAIPALLLLDFFPAPYLASNVFLMFVVVVNLIAALQAQIWRQAHKGDVDAN